VKRNADHKLLETDDVWETEELLALLD